MDFDEMTIRSFTLIREEPIFLLLNIYFFHMVELKNPYCLDPFPTFVAPISTQQTKRIVFNPISKLKEIDMKYFWQRRNALKLVFFVFLVVFFLIQPSGAVDKLKTIVLLETMDVKAVRDRSHWFQVQMKDLGYEEGINMELIILKAKGNYQLAESLLKDALEKRKPDLVLSNATLASQAAKKLLNGTNIPQLFFTVVDPVGAGLVESIGPPTGKNITGRVHSISTEIKTKLVLRLVENQIKTRPIRFGYIHSNYPSAMGDLRELKKISEKNKGIMFIPYEISYKDFPENIDYMLKEMSKGLKQLDGKIDFLWEPLGPFAESIKYNELLKEEATVPVVYGVNRDSLQVGALINIEPDAEAEGREIARLADRILNGEDPGGIPVIPPIKFNLGINLTTAQKMNIVIPPDILKLAKGNIFH